MSHIGLRIGLRILSFIALLCFSISSFALPFNITPASSFPRFIAPGNLITVAYTVANNTISQRNNNFVKYLPPNVSVITGLGCAANFNLAPRGQPGSSCTLFLNVTGPVDARDSNPHHHLFVCFPGGTTCAGTRNPLNVTLSNNLNKFAYIANDNNINTISICPVFPNGNLGPCTAHTDPTFSAPIDVILNNSATIAYVANESNNTISVCPVNPDGSLRPCQATPVPDTGATGLTLNASNTLLYFTQFSFNSVNICQVNPNGSLGTCTPTPPIFSAPDGKATLNNNNTMIYVADFNQSGAGFVSFCNVNSMGQISNCHNFFDPTLNADMLGTAINRANTFLYVFHFNGVTLASSVSICPINANGSLSQPCTVQNGNGTFNFGDDVSINTVFSTNPKLAYVPNGGTGNPTPIGSISICPFVANGALGNCSVFVDPTLHNPDSIFIATFGQFV